MKILILGGSGFIGQNLIIFYSKNKSNFILSLDKDPLHVKSNRVYNLILDLSDYKKLKKEIINFSPDLIINVAAKCDLNSDNIIDYSINYELPKNIIKIINSTPNLNPIILFFSTMLVYKVGYTDDDNIDYNPSTAYGKSKLKMEKIIKKEEKLKWIIVRPTSIWGPGFSTYKNFFYAVKNKWYLKIKNSRPKKSYGFIYNIVAQIDAIINNEICIHETFYLGDYEPMYINDWSDLIADQWGVRRPLSISKFILYPISVFGSFLSVFRIKFPMTIFRYNNMTTENFINKEKTKNICPKLPYTIKKGVILTIEHLKKKNENIRN